jgi:multiple sugar transport system permease protein
MFRSEKVAKWVLASPLLLFIVLMVVFPAAYAILLSFQDVSLSKGQVTFRGFGNYMEVLKQHDFWHTILFTLKFTVITTTFELILGFLLALLFDRPLPGKRFLLSVVLLPIMVAPSLMGIMFRLILNENNGIATYFLNKLHLQINLFDPSMVVPLLIILDIMQWVPFTFLILYSGLQGVDRGLYEAASVDGASYWRTIFQLIFPVIRPIFFIAAFLRGIDSFRTFDVIYVLTNGGPGNASKTASIYIYQTAFKAGNIGLAAASSVIIAILLMSTIPFFVKKLVR